MGQGISKAALTLRQERFRRGDLTARERAEIDSLREATEAYSNITHSSHGAYGGGAGVSCANKIAAIANRLAEAVHAVRLAAGYAPEMLALVPNDYGQNSMLWQDLDEDYLSGRRLLRRQGSMEFDNGWRLMWLRERGIAV